jgi:hypothetical protein
VNTDKTDSTSGHPFDVPAIAAMIDDERSVKLHRAVTIFVEDNGSGKSTLLEAIAVNQGSLTQSTPVQFKDVEPGKKNGLDGACHQTQPTRSIALVAERVVAAIGRVRAPSRHAITRCPIRGSTPKGSRVLWRDPEPSGQRLSIRASE